MLIVLFKQQPNGELTAFPKTYKTWEGLENHSMGFGGPMGQIVSDNGSMRQYRTSNGSVFFGIDVMSYCLNMVKSR